MKVRKDALRRFMLGVVGVLAASGAACTSTTEPPGEERRPGLILGFNHGDPQIVMPDTVQAGTEFTVQVTTYGNGCYRKGETEVAASGSVVTITPWDYVNLGAGACPDLLLTFVHEATVAFSQAGSASVVIVGRSGGSMGEEPVEVTRPVVVVAAQASN
ncbi:MAG: hypothetical protein EA421_09385 [Gemmatimonadales bacterium]|nr:MAG: hypothetical protein EA421_09385 [Gemmatimonadales bacterium]